MNTLLVSDKALSVVNQYLHFHFNDAVASIPYFNNKRKVVRGGLRGLVGKGSPRDIFDEVEIAITKDKNTTIGSGITHAADGGAPLERGAIKAGSYLPDALTDDALKHFLVDHNIGIDCSGFVYYALEAELLARGKSTLDRYISFPFSKGILSKIRSKFRPVENTGVATLAHDNNSRRIDLVDIKPADIITMTEGPQERDHVLLVHQVDYQNFKPTTIHYTHSIAWPSDGVYGTGVRQGTIDILDIKKPITEQSWSEAGTISSGKDANTQENYTFARALKARTEIRRMLSL